MKILKPLFVITLCLVFFSCNKEKPETGHYAGFFNYTTPLNIDKYSQIEISESKSDYIVINGSKLKKDGKKISGMIHALDFGSFVEIDGELKHKAFSKDYSIEGTFTQIQYGGGNQYNFSGTFGIKSD